MKRMIMFLSAIVLSDIAQSNENEAPISPPLGAIIDSKLEGRGGLKYLKTTDTPYSGKFYSIYSNGQIKMIGNLKRGIPDGLQQAWHENKQEAYRMTFKDARVVGLSTQWHSNGRKKTETLFKSNGKGIVYDFEWHSNGLKKHERIYDNKNKLTYSMAWSDKGNYIRADGALNQEQCEFRAGGVLYRKGSNVPFSGKTYKLWANGNKRGEMDFRNGKINGRILAWHPNRQRKMEVFLVNGKTISEKYWNTKGEHVTSEEADN